MKSHTSQPDSQEERFNSWLSAHQDIVAKVSRSFAAGGDVEDLAFEILLQLWKTASSFRGEASAEVLIYRVALNHAVMWEPAELKPTTARSDRARRALAFGNGSDESSEQLDRIYATLQTFPAVDRVLLLLLLDDLGADAIAQIIGITEQEATVAKAQLDVARTRLVEDSNAGRDLSRVWEQQPVGPAIAPVADLVTSLREGHRYERIRQLQPHLEQLIPAVGMGVWFGWLGMRATSRSVELFAAAAIGFLIGLFVVVSVLRQQGRERRFDVSVRGDLARKRSRFMQQAKLHRTVLWWYLVPGSLAVLLALRATNVDFAAPQTLAYLVVLVCGAGLLYRSNRQRSRTIFEPQIETVSGHVRDLDTVKKVSV